MARKFNATLLYKRKHPSNFFNCFGVAVNIVAWPFNFSCDLLIRLFVLILCYDCWVLSAHSLAFDFRLTWLVNFGLNWRSYNNFIWQRNRTIGLNPFSLNSLAKVNLLHRFFYSFNRRLLSCILNLFTRDGFRRQRTTELFDRCRLRHLDLEF